RATFSTSAFKTLITSNSPGAPRRYQVGLDPLISLADLDAAIHNATRATTSESYLPVVSVQILNKIFFLPPFIFR
ncbi:hypothetical protein, partial [Pseudomonas syringae]|uniref:hypothetical protein n=1 Tax=Pseudomonas syringae TaxID=317 RepID=UPI0019681B2E